MAIIYYKFKSAKDYNSISIDGQFISVIDLKERIYESKRLGRGTDYDLIVTNAQTNEEYVDETIMLPGNSSVLIRRVPGPPCMPIVVAQPKVIEDDDQTSKNNSMTVSNSSEVQVSDLDDDFGDDLYATVALGQATNVVHDIAPLSKAEEDAKIQALVANSGLDWGRKSGDASVLKRKRVSGDACVWKRQFGDGSGKDGRGCAGAGLERNRPPPDYICFRCKVPGHLIQHCPTNGDPDYDIKRVKPPTGIPKSMLVPTPDGFYVLPSGTSAVLKPNEAAFDKEMEGLPSTRPVRDVPPALHCPLCKQVMKDAVLTSKCCLDSCCDKCIRDYIMSKKMCVCGVRDVLADYLLPNKTMRDTINRILESGNSGSANTVGTATHVQDAESARRPPAKVASPTGYAASKGAEKSSNVDGNKSVDAPQLQVQPQTLVTEKIVKVLDSSEATHESVSSVKEPVSHGRALPIKKEVQQRVAAGDTGKNKKRKKTPMPMYAAQMQWLGMQAGIERYDMGVSNFNLNLPGMQPPMNESMGYFGGNMSYNTMNYYGLGPMDMPSFGNVYAS